MFTKIFSALAIAAVGIFGLVACDKTGSDSAMPASQVARNNSSWVESVDEINDEGGITSRVAAATITDGVFQVMKVTAQYSTTGTNTSAAIAVINGSQATATLSTTAVTSAAGYSKFSVKADKFNTFVKRKVSNSAGQTYYMLDRDAKTYKRCGAVTGAGATFTFLPTYLKSGITVGAGTLTGAVLE